LVCTTNLASITSNRSERLREGIRLRREAREDRINEDEDRRLQVARSREREISKERFEVRPALEEGLAALKDEAGDEADSRVLG
jgi:hypothetical protein